MTTTLVRPTVILDGLVGVYSTCRSCGEIMLVVNHGDHTHPTCPPQLTKVEQWEASWLEIASSAPYEKLLPELRNKLDRLERQIDQAADESAKTALYDAAVQYAQWGFRIFPLAPRSKKPFIRNAHGRNDPLRGVCKGECGKPGHGVWDATNDVARVEKWWSYHSDHNIGVATGFGFDVIDVDPGHGGIQSFSTLLEAGRIPIVHGLVATAGADKPFRPSGMHLYVRPTGRGNFADVMPGVDYRGLGGYAVAPPSTLGSRVRSWSWAVEPSPVLKGGG